VCHYSARNSNFNESGTEDECTRFTIMENIHFPAVTVETTRIGQLRNITSVTQAAAFLLSEWPGKRGRLHGLARQACLEALEGNVAGDLARTAFVDAAREADIYKGAWSR
jgi:hypothetical protein